MLNKIGEHISAFMLVIITIDIIALIISLLLIFDEPKYDEITLEVEDFIIEHVKLPECDSGKYIEELEVHTLIDNDSLDMLAHIMNAEAGSDWCTDELQLAVGSVVLNRIASDKFPNNMHDVIFQEGQYSPTWNGAYYKEPSERSYANAKYLLEHGSVIPGYIWQANFKQGTDIFEIQGVYFGR